MSNQEANFRCSIARSLRLHNSHLFAFAPYHASVVLHKGQLTCDVRRDIPHILDLFAWVCAQGRGEQNPNMIGCLISKDPYDLEQISKCQHSEGHLLPREPFCSIYVIRSCPIANRQRGVTVNWIWWRTAPSLPMKLLHYLSSFMAVLPNLNQIWGRPKESWDVVVMSIKRGRMEWLHLRIKRQSLSLLFRGRRRAIITGWARERMSAG